METVKEKASCLAKGLEKKAGNVIEKAEDTAEQKLSKLPAKKLLWTVAGCVGAWVVLRMVGLKRLSQLARRMTAPVLAMATYDKIAKAR
jgi:hypothetical protein